MDEKVAQVLSQSPLDVSEDRVRGIIEGMSEEASVTDILAIIWKLKPKVQPKEDQWRMRNDYMDAFYENIENAGK